MCSVCCILAVYGTLYKQGLSIQRDKKHGINVADNKNYSVGTVSYLQTL